MMTVNKITQLTDDHLNRIVISALLFSIFSAAVLFVVGFYYSPLGCDGGWYSYPALALSKGGDPVQNRTSIEEAKTIRGVKALFPFETYQSIRIVYTTLWFKYVQKNIYFLKVLSMLEFIALMSVIYLLMYKFTEDRTIAFAVLALLLNDKVILLNAASDFRPDIVVGVFACLIFFLLLRPTSIGNLLFVLMAVVALMLTHLTAVIPLFFILCYFMLKNLLAAKYDIKSNYVYLLVGMVAAMVFFNRDRIFTFLFPSSNDLGSVVSLAATEASDVFGKGLQYILVVKEWTRWKGYFGLPNVMVLCGLLTGAILFFARPSINLKANNRIGLSLLLSTCATLVLVAASDPHWAFAHVIPVVPLIFLLVAHQIHIHETMRKPILLVFITFVFLNCIISIAVAGKMYYSANKAGYNIAIINERLNSILSTKTWQYTIVGPTEIWPFINENREILIIDTVRTGSDFEKLSPVLHSIDYVILNADYEAYRWEDKFHTYFPDVVLEDVCSLGDKNKFLRIYKMNHKHPVSGRLQSTEMQMIKAERNTGSAPDVQTQSVVLSALCCHGRIAGLLFNLEQSRGS